MKEELKRRRKTNKRWLLLPAALLIAALAGGGWYYSHQENFIERKFERAQGLLIEKNYAEAAHLLQTLTRQHPDFNRADEALFRLGEVQHLYLKKDQDALLTFLLVEKNYPDSPFNLRAQRLAADIYMDRLEDYGRAVIAYQKLLDQGVAEGDQLQYRIGEAYFRLNNFEQARIEWESLLKLFPDSSLVPEAGYRIAVSWSLEGEYEQAAEEFERVYATWPEHPYGLEARFGLASLLEEQEQLVAALEILQELRGHYPRPEVLEQRIIQVEERIEKKQDAI
ncbi:tetratricopeptide repeat protein [Geoalkalibacter ferrihydriticus]|uniref:tetratricopeptide repeat protein n=1 Tax=Geoalkalibacter ferrihydriticus TaxID=392333 RepID=UPI001379248F|nr:tetratricopeptide repeat protein [Geoalkalibacter ferrihydriticus]